ncbi:MAG TPA: hypothetical protein VF481_07310 [Novosphingobium sp.]
MTELIIGLCIGVACAIVLAVMWRAAEKLRRELRSDDETIEEKRAPAGKGPKDLSS